MVDRPIAVLPARLFDRVLRMVRAQRAAVVIALDAIVMTLALPAALLLRDKRSLGDYDVEVSLELAGMLLAIAVATGLVTGSYRALWRYLSSAEILQLVKYALIVLVAFYLGRFLVDRLADIPRSVPVIHFLIAVFGLLGMRLLYGLLAVGAAGNAARHVPSETILLVGSGEGTSFLVHMLTRSQPGNFEVAGILCDDIAANRSIGGVPFLGRLESFDTVIVHLRVQGIRIDRVIVTQPHHELGREAVYRLMQRASEAAVPVQQLPDLLSLSLAERSSTLAGPEPVAGSPSGYLRLKRGMDAILAGLLLIVLAPVFALIAAAVAVGVQRRVVFAQIRPGRHRRPFRLYKFRTMRDPCADAHGRIIDDDAARITALGHLLRRTRLDELPQLWNVFRGDMALIGPRPLLARDLDAMGDRGLARCALRPGLTGWAQVNGGHLLAGEEKLALDLWYAQHAGLWLDLEIVLRTFDMVVRGERRSPEAIRRARSSRDAVRAGAA